MTTEQYGFRFRNDDGNETTATWMAAQNTDTDVAYGVNFRLRMGLNISGGVSLNQEHVCTYRIVGEDWWYRLDPLAALTFDTVAYPTAGAVNSTTTSIVPNFPTSDFLIGRSLIIVGILQKPATANTGGITPPSGWQSAGSSGYGGGYGGTTGADVGNIQIRAYYAIHQENVDPTFTLADNSVSIAIPLSLNNNLGDAEWDIDGVGGEDTSGDATFSVTFGSDPGVQAGDVIIVLIACAGDAVAGFTSPALSQAGITFGTVSLLVEGGTSNGNDIEYGAFWALVTAGTSSGVPTFSCSVGGTTTNARGPGLFIRIRGTAAQRVVAALSGNFVSSVNTTAQLTPPAGKLTSDFDAGRMIEGVAETASVAISTDDYSEDEWTAQATALAVNEDVDFRMFQDVGASLLLDTYTEVPRLSISDPTAATVRNLAFFMG